MVDTALRAASAPHFFSPCYAKVPRDRVARLVVEAEPGRGVLRQILALLARLPAEPFTVSVERDDQGQRLSFEIDRLHPVTAAALLRKARAIMHVRSALLDP